MTTVSPIATPFLLTNLTPQNNAAVSLPTNISVQPSSDSAFPVDTIDIPPASSGVQLLDPSTFAEPSGSTQVPITIAPSTTTLAEIQSETEADSQPTSLGVQLITPPLEPSGITQASLTVTPISGPSGLLEQLLSEASSESSPNISQPVSLLA